MQLQQCRVEMMDRKKTDKTDFLIVGSGFAGSILAMCLIKIGYNVCLVEKKRHPRFAIGESSTPIADMILRDLAKEYNLPFLNKISRYGDWQRNYPEVVCGLKRGFSYYQHTKGTPFKKDKEHTKDLLVAASVDDKNSDTNWLRSDVDHFLVKKAVETGVISYERTEVTGLTRMPEKNRWKVVLKDSEDIIRIEAEWIIDATGSPEFSNRFLGTSVTDDPFYTNSSAIFTHMHDVSHWSDQLHKIGHHTEDYPYNPDHSALHHLIDEGWIWMLRFKNDLLSCGFMLDGDMAEKGNHQAPDEVWWNTINSYPSLREIFKKWEIAKLPGRFIQTERLQRLLTNNHGDGWIALNHTTGFVDPMHSTGIAHSLKGIEDLLSIFNSKQRNLSEVNKRLDKMYEITRKEISLIDKMVSMAYTSRFDFELFHAAVMLYFVATVQYEQKRLREEKPEAFLCATDAVIDELVTITHRELNSMKGNFDKKSRHSFIQKLKKRVDPLNRVGLMDNAKNHMYRHTAVTL
ncbi:MAG: NAD(P)/FAD-dependent oxidoreductase [Balneolaceae bacterium]